MMKIKQKVSVYRVGHGTIQDDRTGVVVPWCKVYCLDSEPVKNDGMYGLPENHYQVLGADGKPDSELAKRILAHYESLSPKGLVQIEFNFTLVNSGKKQVMAITELLVPASNKVA